MTTTTPEEELRRLVLARLDALVSDGAHDVRILPEIADQIVDLVGPLADDVVSAYYGRDAHVPGIDLDGVPAEVVLCPLLPPGTAYIVSKEALEDAAAHARWEQSFDLFERLRRGEHVTLPHGRDESADLKRLRAENEAAIRAGVEEGKAIAERAFRKGGEA